MKILIACEFSGIVRDAFTALGHDAASCDLLPSESPGKHYQRDIRDILTLLDWDLLIAHPPCTYLSRAGARWWKKPERMKLADDAANFVFILRDAPIKRIAIENPIGQLNQRWRYPDQTIQPYQFGDPYSKATCLWLKNLPLLKPTLICEEYQPFINCNRGNRKKAGLPVKGICSGGKKGSVTFKGIASAMAHQWGGL